MPSSLKPLGKPRILVAPLDWGLGHATRCIPVIYELMGRNAEPWLAGDDPQETILRREFPSLPFLKLNGYRVKYGRSARGLLRSMFFQWPKLKRMISYEHEWLKNVVEEHSIDAVISDNRFGLYHEKIPAVFITHQLHVKSPLGKWSEGFLQKLNYQYINRFNYCWVPDSESANNLAGELSHPQRMPVPPVTYVGCLSRMKKKSVEAKPGHLFISLSGPEPQRSILEDKLINQLSRYNGTAVVVRGLPDARTLIPSTNDIQFYNHLSTDEYSEEMERAEFVICRSGYSTVMDLVRLGKKSILIPTPGQAEQEYLGGYLMENGIAVSVDQDDFVLTAMLEKARSFAYRPFIEHGNSLSAAVKELLEMIKISN